MNMVADVFEETYFADILHIVAQVLWIPTMVAIIGLLLLTLFLIGQAIVEKVTVFRKRTVDTEALVNGINEAPWSEVAALVDRSELLRVQKQVLCTVAANRQLPDEALFSLAQLQVEKARKAYTSRLAWTDMTAKVAPLLGLMGTLIPLGPGIVALGQKNVELLSQSLLVAFDATVCGLVCSIAALVLSKIRSRWYAESISTLKALCDCLLEKADLSRKNAPDGCTSTESKEA